MHGSQMIYATLLMIAQAWPSTGASHPELVEGCDPALTAIFTPRHTILGRYEVCTVDESIDQAIAAGSAEGLRFGDVDALEALDAFGGAGSYDRFAVARLYGGTRARVAHGWRQDRGGLESVTLISPYPDVSFTRLMPGTMTIRWTTSPSRRGL